MRRTDLTFNDVQQAAAGVFILYPNSPFFVVKLRLQDPCVDGLRRPKISEGMEKPPASWNIPVPRATEGEPSPKVLPAGPWNIPSPGTRLGVHVKHIHGGMIVTTTYDEGTVIKATMHEDGRVNLHVNKPVVVDLDAREIRIRRS